MNKSKKQESGLVRHARRELELSGLFDKDSDYGGMIGQSIMELVEVFSKQEHSGYSASIVRNIFNKITDFKTISPLTGENSEWNNISNEPTHITYQNNRNSAMFKEGPGAQAYYLEAILWRNQKGTTYEGSAYIRTTGECIVSAQYIKAFPFNPKTFYIDVIEEEVKKGDWVFYIKNVADLDKVWEVYDRK